ncbi:MAG TPA: alkaline phosphatase D family protein [Candidatus Limnocylindria bacterium]|nr:alkaline phosphatase D family protein [Candidatus Limnocylindria bacterium]
MLTWARRFSAAVLLLGAAPSGLGPGAFGDAALAPGTLVTVAEVSAHRALLWLRAPDGAPVAIRYGAAGEPVAVTEATPSAARDFTARVPLERLWAGTRYQYEVRAAGERVTGAFTTAPAADTDTPVRLAWSGDLGGAGHCREVEDGYRIFRAMSARAPDAFLFVGDTIYADHRCGRAQLAGADYVASSLDELYGKHRYNRADAAVQHFFRRTSVYATWDDHEVENNFGPGHELMPAGRRAFQDYFALEGVPDDPGRIYRSARWGRHVEIFILDTRQYRSPNTDADGPAKTMLGAAQRRWLLAGVSASDATWKLIVSSVPLGIFTGGAHSDSWSNANVFGYPREGTGFVHERDLILRSLHERGVGNVVFISGDVHHAEILRHEPAPGFVVHELIAGPLAARRGYPRFLDRSLGSRSLGSLGWAQNFGEIVADGAGLRVNIVDSAGTVRVSRRLPAERRAMPL